MGSLQLSHMEKTKKIAIVGGGVSGLAALWLLNEHSPHEVELFEACPTLGGHANTICFQQPGKEPCWVDTAFLMINRAGWPNFCHFLDRTSVKVKPSSGTYSLTRGDQAWSSSSLSALFAGPNGWRDVRRWTMIIDILRFDSVALDAVRGTPAYPEEKGEESVGRWCERNGFSDAFVNDYLVPLAATVWSIPPLKILNHVPIRTIVEGLFAMDMLKLFGRSPWLQIQGGSREYIHWIADRAKGSVHVNTPVVSVSDTTAQGATITLQDGSTRTYDHIIMATHADISHRLLKAGGSLRSDVEDLLTANEWSECEVIMHYDERLMPHPTVWSAWNNFVDADKGLADRHSSTTFDVNLLHDLDVRKHGHVFGSINPPIQIDESKIVARLRYSDFVLGKTDQATFSSKVDPARRVSFAGAWTGLGTHEDGWNSGIAAAEALGGVLPWGKHARSRPVPELDLWHVMCRLVVDAIAKLWAILVSWFLGRVQHL